MPTFSKKLDRLEAMPTSRKKLLGLARLLFKREVESWPLADVVAYLRDGRHILREAKHRRKSRLAELEKLATADTDPDATTH